MALLTYLARTSDGLPLSASTPEDERVTAVASKRLLITMTTPRSVTWPSTSNEPRK